MRNPRNDGTYETRVGHGGGTVIGSCGAVAGSWCCSNFRLSSATVCWSFPKTLP